MKRNKYARIGSMEQPMESGFQSLLEQQQQATSLPLIPTADNELPLTLRVAKVIVPTETVGGAVDTLMGLRDLDANPDCKAVINFDEDYKARVVIMPSAAANNGVCLAFGTSPGDAIVEVTRDDADSETSSHSLADGSLGEDEDNDAAQAIKAVVADLIAAAKPKRSIESLINAFVDRCKALEIDLTGVALLHDTQGDGKLTIYGNGGGVGTLVGKLADVTQDDEPADPTKATRW